VLVGGALRVDEPDEVAVRDVHVVQVQAERRAGGLVGDPCVVALSNGATAVFARTTGGRVMGTSQRTAFGPYDPWSYVAAGGNIVTDPQAVVAGGVTVLYGTADDGHCVGDQPDQSGRWLGGLAAALTPSGVDLGTLFPTLGTKVPRSNQ
jgi:hypothetical protein